MYFIGCILSGWSKFQWSGCSANLQVSKELSKVTKLVDIVTLAIAVFETSMSKALNNGETNEQEVGILQALHLKVVNELANVNPKMESAIRDK